MTAEVRWVNDQHTAIEISMWMPIEDWGEFDRAMDQTVVMLKQQPRNVALIINPNGAPMPRRSSPLPHLLRMFKMLPANVPIVIAIYANQGMFERAIANILLKVGHEDRLRIVNTMDQALSLLSSEII